MFKKTGWMLSSLLLIEFIVFMLLTRIYSTGNLVIASLFLLMFGVIRVTQTLPKLLKSSAQNIKNKDMTNLKNDYKPRTRFLSALLFLFPGFLTASLGVLLYFPPLAKIINNHFTLLIDNSFLGKAFNKYQGKYKDVIDVDSETSEKTSNYRELSNKKEYKWH